MELDYWKSPWFLMAVAFVVFGSGYIVADDKRIERENELSCTWVKAETQDKPIKLVSWKETEK